MTAGIRLTILQTKSHCHSDELGKPVVGFLFSVFCFLFSVFCFLFSVLRGHWSLVIGHWSLVIVHCSLFIETVISTNEYEEKPIPFNLEPPLAG